MKYLAIALFACVIAAAIVAGCGGGGGGGSSLTSPSSSSSGATAGSTAGYTAGSTAGTTSGTTSGGAGQSASVAVINNSSAPMGFSFQSPVTVKSGTVVTWVNQSAAPHGITWDAQSPSSSPPPGADIPVFSAGSNSQTFTAPTVTTSTTYNYHCTVHGPTMAGQLIVTP